MEIVVKIPDDMIKSLEQGNFGAKYNIYELVGCLMNGTPLPEHHGDLVDRNRICKAIYAAEDNLTGSGMTYDEMDIYNDGIDSMWNKLQNADPIIEAERGESESE